MKNVPLFEPTFFGNELSFLEECIDTGWISSAGPFVNKFEEEIANYLGAKYAVAVTSGTAALHLALLCNDIGVNDEVIVPTITFIATANAVIYTGAFPTFLDVDSQHWHLDSNCLLDFFKKECVYKKSQWVNRNTGRCIKAIIPVHLMGNPCEMNNIHEVACQYGIPIVEDAAQSLGSTYYGKHMGTFGTAGCLSFNGNKILTCGSGGMITTNVVKIAERAKYLSTQAKQDAKNYIHHEVGYNYRFSNLHAAIGLAQLKNFQTILKCKKEIANYYRKVLVEIPELVLPIVRENCISNEWLMTVLLDTSVHKSVFEIRDLLENSGIQTRPLWQPMHQSKAFKNCYSYKVSIADIVYKKALSLPSSANLSLEDINYIVTSLKKVL